MYGSPPARWRPHRINKKTEIKKEITGKKEKCKLRHTRHQPDVPLCKKKKVDEVSVRHFSAKKRAPNDLDTYRFSEQHREV